MKRKIVKMIKKLSDIRYKQINLFLRRNPQKKIVYIIRFFQGEGLMSMLYKACAGIEFARYNGYIPMIDLQHFKNIYRIKDKNSWEEFFEQPEEYKENAAGGGARQYIISDCVHIRKVNEGLFSKYWAQNFEYDPAMTKTFQSMITVNSNILGEVQRLEEAMDISDCIGVLARGTDYANLKPKGHPIQPNKEEIGDKIEEYVLKYQKRVFLVTEDREIKNYLLNRFENRIITLDDDVVFGEVTNNKLLWKMIEQEKSIEVGKVYLKKILLLSRCRYLIAGKTNGSLMALIMSRSGYEDRYVFDKGYYD